MGFISPWCFGPWYRSWTKKPTTITNKSGTEEKIIFQAWERSNKWSLKFMWSNRWSLKFMWMIVANNIKSTLPKTDNAKEFLKSFGKHFWTTDKSLVGMLMATLTTMNFYGTHGMHEDVLEMTNLAGWLKTLEMKVDEFFPVQFILNSFPP